MVAVYALALISCNKDMIRASGNVITQEMNVAAFGKVDVSHGIKLYVELTDEVSGRLTVKADDNIMGYLEIYVSDGELNIGVEEGVVFRGSPTIKVYANTLYLTEVEASGGAQVRCENAVTSNNLDIELGGGSQFYGTLVVEELDIELGGGSKAEISCACNRLDMELHGGSRAEVSGTCTDVQLVLHGGSRVTDYAFEIENAIIRLHGGSSARLTVTETLDIEAHGGSSFKYKGSPAVIHMSSDGGSSIDKVG